MPDYKRPDSRKKPGQFPPRKSNPPKFPIPSSRERRNDDGAPRYDDHPRYGDKPRRDDRPRHDDRSTRGDKWRYGDAPRDDRPPRNDRPPREYVPRHDEHSRYNDNSHDDRRGGYHPPADNDRPPREYAPPRDDRRGGYHPPADNDRPPREYAPPRDDRRGGYHPPADNDRPRFDDRPRYDEPENLLAGRNPIREALKSGQSFEKLLVADGELAGSAREILSLARERGVVVQYVDRRKLDGIYPNHQGMIGFISAGEYSSIDDIFALAAERGEDPLIVVLDGITDPHNLGAIARSCECMGAHGIIIPQRRSVGLTPAAIRASAGAFSYLKIAREVNLNRALETLKQHGVWITGTVMDGASIERCNLKGPIALVIGAEEDGISALVKKNCDQLATIPMAGRIASLNASVASGIMLYEIARARRA